MEERPAITDDVKRVAAVLRPDLNAGEAANAAAIVVAGLRCEAFGTPVLDINGNPHASVFWNVLVLKAKSAGQFVQMIQAARAREVSVIAFTGIGQALSNDFEGYARDISQRQTTEVNIIALGLFGSDEAVRALTRKCSLYK